MVRALAGDSTMTSDVVPGSAGGSSSSSAAVRRARALDVAAAFAVFAVFAAGRFAVLPVAFLGAAIVSVYGRRIAVGAGVRQPHAVEDGTKHGQVDAATAVVERMVEHALEIGGGENATGVELQDAAPRLGSEAAPLVGAGNANRRDRRPLERCGAGPTGPRRRGAPV